MTTLPASERPSPQVSDIVVTEELLGRFDRAIGVSRLDDSLFDPTVGDDLSARLDVLVAAVKALDLDSMARRRDWRARLVGADLEARVRFAVDRQACSEAYAAARIAAQHTAHRITRLQAALPAVEADQTRLTGVAEKATRIAANIAPASDAGSGELIARFQRRMGNLTAILSANALAVSQIKAAIRHYSLMLDRFADVETVLFPVWERHALAMVQSAPTEEIICEARKAARALIDRLMARIETSA